MTAGRLPPTGQPVIPLVPLIVDITSYYKSINESFSFFVVHDVLNLPHLSMQLPLHASISHIPSLTYNYIHALTQSHTLTHAQSVTFSLGTEKGISKHPTRVSLKLELR